jgi:hypothetical protein
VNGTGVVTTDRETEPGTRVPLHEGLTELPERLDDSLLDLGRNAPSVVAHLDGDPVVTFEVTHDNLPPRLGVFNGVGHEIHDDLLDVRGVGTEDAVDE